MPADQPATGEWLDEFVSAERSTAHPKDPIGFADDAPLDPSQAELRERREREQEAAEDAAAFWPESSHDFWTDLGGSFAFFIHSSNLIAFVIITFANIWLAMLGFAGIVGLIGTILLYGYLCAFYMSTVVETAAGDNELPDVWFSNILDDLIAPMCRYLGTWLAALLPAIATFIAIQVYNWGGMMNFMAATFAEVGKLLLAGPSSLLAPGPLRIPIIVGIALWPAIVLATAITGGFHGFRPDRMFRTATAAPLAYAAVCAVVVIAALLRWLPDTSLAGKVLGTGLGARVRVSVLHAVLGAYSMILTMRAIGLYYRHYKHKLPWAAE